MVLTESAKLRALVPYVPRAPHASCPACCCASHALVPYVPRALRALVSRALRASYSTCSLASGASCPTCSRALRASCPTCSRASRALHALCLIVIDSSKYTLYINDINTLYPLRIATCVKNEFQNLQTGFEV